MARPNLSGHWQFDPAASRLEIPVPDRVEFVIEHEEPRFRLERTLTLGGRSETFSVQLTVGAANPPFPRGDATIAPLLRWEGDDLLFESRIARGEGEATNTVRYRLDDAGRTLVAKESYRGGERSYDNRWVFRRERGAAHQPPNRPTLLDTVGGTPVVELHRVVPADAARVLVKLESHNPTGSMKDRMALAVVAGAEASGRLPPGGTVVEYTGGSTGTSLAFVCAAKGYAITLVTSDAFSREKRDQMRALGATVIELPSDGGRTTKELIQRMIAKAAELSAAPATFYADQFNNPDAAAGYAPLAEELWQQAGGQLDAFVQTVGTAQCLTGIARTLRGRRPGIRIVAVEPAESPVLSGGAPGAHKIEGVGPGFVPPIWRPEVADAIEPVSTADAQQMAQRLAREEALFAGTSTGANVVAALRVAEHLGPGRTVATLACDTGLKYLSTPLYASS